MIVARVLDPRFDEAYRRSPIVLVDAGARGGLKPNWRAAERHLSVIGFEPDPNEYARLAAVKGGPTYFGVALHHTKAPIRFHITRDRGLSSMFEPNRAFLVSFPDAARFDIVSTQDIEADALDTLLPSRGIAGVDFIKADTQGSELFVLQGAAKTLESSVVGVEVEAEFAPIYKDQPLFSDVDAFLRARGFLLFDLRPVYWKREAGRNVGGPHGQIVWTDALYLRSLPALDAALAPRDAAAKQATVLHLISIAVLYGYVDYALEVASAQSALFSPDERVTIDRALRSHTDPARRTARFPGRGPLARASRRLWRWLREPNDGWSVSDPDLGNRD
jgi:FkbM family methyltransferase